MGNNACCSAPTSRSKNDKKPVGVISRDPKMTESKIERKRDATRQDLSVFRSTIHSNEAIRRKVSDHFTISKHASQEIRKKY